jgi:mRNA-degrading endonuclease RelE of RelBE toxin-antitoxin system
MRLQLWLHLYEVRFAPEALEKMRSLRVFDRQRVYDAIRDELVYAPTTPTRNLAPLLPRSAKITEHGPLWRLRVGELRVYYRVFEEKVLVLVVKVARKGRKTTEEVL